MYRDLSRVADSGLYEALDSVDRLRACEGQGREPEAAHVRMWCRREKERISRELRERGLPTGGPGRGWTGIGQGLVCRPEEMTVGEPV